MFENWNAAAHMIQEDDAYFSVPSDDDVYLPHAFATIQNTISQWAHEGVDIFIFGHIVIDAEGVRSPGYCPAQLSVHEAPSGFRHFPFGVAARMPSIFIRKAFFDRIGGFDESFLLTASDSDFVQRALLSGKSLFVPAVVAGYRVWPGGATAQSRSSDAWMVEICRWANKTRSALTDLDSWMSLGVPPDRVGDEIVAANLLSAVHSLCRAREWDSADRLMRAYACLPYARRRTRLRLAWARTKATLRIS